MRETENSFIVYNIDLPMWVYRNQDIFNGKEIDKLTIDDIACKILNVQLKPQSNCSAIKEAFDEYCQFVSRIRERNDKNLPIIYEDLTIDEDDEDDD